MITISVCMIVKNEEAVLERALTSIQSIADEIIIVDTGSIDATKEIASRFSNKIYDFAWCDDFAKARNSSFSKATKEYCMWLDADDILLEKDQKDLLVLKETLSPATSIVMMKYNTSFDKQNNPTFTYYRERLLRRKDNFVWEGFVHEVIPLKGEIIYSDIAISHRKLKSADSSRNLNLYQTKLKEGILFTARDMFYYARELYYHKQYEEAINEFKRFLGTHQGWIENNISACQFLGYCFYQKNDIIQAIQCLLNSLNYDVPRAELCCDLGRYFYEISRYEQAIYWYGTALSCDRDDTSGAFVLVDCYDYIPYIQLCLCYDKIGNHKIASFYNDLAGECKPNDPAYLYNKAYFDQMK